MAEEDNKDETTAPPEEDKEWLDENKIMLGVGVFGVVCCCCCCCLLCIIAIYLATKKGVEPPIEFTYK
jgi:hypothetical protein